MSPRKLRLVADVVRELEPIRALEILPHVGKRAAGPMAKVVKSAIANAKQKGFSEGDLIFKEIQINDGPTLKRGRPVSRGRWHPIKKRMSHIKVVLTTRNLSKKETKGLKNIRTEKQDKEVDTKVRKGNSDQEKILKKALKKAVSRKNSKDTKRKGKNVK
jgi:large subunit ribosomal protein L22